MATRRCAGKTKRGAACKSPPLTGHDVCIAHAGAEERGAAGFGGPQPGSGRPRVPRPRDVAERLVEEHVLEILRPYFRALGLELHDDGSTSPCEGPIKYVWAGPDEPAVEVLDLGAQIAAAEKLQDRVYGKPRQQLEHAGADGGPIELELGDADVREALFDVARRIDAARGRDAGER